MANELQYTGGSVNLSNLITTSIRRKFVPILRNKLRFSPYGKKGKLTLHGGAKVLRWNRFDDIGTYTTALTENTLSNENKVNTLTVTAVLMTLSDYGAYAPISDLANSVWTTETRNEYASIFAYSGAKTKDTLERNAAQDTTNYFIAGQTAVNGGATPATAASTAIAQDLNVIRGFFDQNDCDGFDSLDGNYALFIHGEVEQDMVGDVTTTRLSWSPLIQNVNPQAGRITAYKGPGALLGMAVMRTNNIQQETLTNTITAYTCVALADYGFGVTTMDQSEPRIIMKRPGNSTLSVPLDTYGTIGWKMRMAQGLLDSNRALRYYAAK